MQLLTIMQRSGLRFIQTQCVYLSKHKTFLNELKGNSTLT